VILLQWADPLEAEAFTHLTLVAGAPQYRADIRMAGSVPALVALLRRYKGYYGPHFAAAVVVGGVAGLIAKVASDSQFAFDFRLLPACAPLWSYWSPRVGC